MTGVFSSVFCRALVRCDLRGRTPSSAKKPTRSLPRTARHNGKGWPTRRLHRYHRRRRRWIVIRRRRLRAAGAARNFRVHGQEQHLLQDVSGGADREFALRAFLVWAARREGKLVSGSVGAVARTTCTVMYDGIAFSRKGLPKVFRDWACILGLEGRHDPGQCEDECPSSLMHTTQGLKGEWYFCHCCHYFESLFRSLRNTVMQLVNCKRGEGCPPFRPMHFKFSTHLMATQISFSAKIKVLLLQNSRIQRPSHALTLNGNARRLSRV